MEKEKTLAEKLKEVEALPLSMQRAGLERVIGNKDKIRKFVSEHQVCQIGDYAHVIYKGEGKPKFETGSIPLYAAIELLSGAIPCEYHMSQFLRAGKAKAQETVEEIKLQEIPEESKVQESEEKAADKEFSEGFYGLPFTLKTGGSFDYIVNVLIITNQPYHLVSINDGLGFVGVRFTKEYEKKIESLTISDYEKSTTPKKSPLDEASDMVKGLDELIGPLIISKQLKKAKELTERESRELYEKAKVYTPNR